MTDAALYDDELNELEEQLSTQLRAVSAATSRGARGDAVTKAQDMLRRLTKIYQQFRVEVRMLDRGAASAIFEKKMTEHQTRLNQLREEVQTAKKEQQQQQQQQQQTAPRSVRFNTNPDLTSSTGGGGGGERLHNDEASHDAAAPSTGNAAYSLWSPVENDPEEAGRQEARTITGRVHETQAETLQSLANTEKLLNETETTGTQAHATLRKQTEQIEQTNTQLDEMNTEVGRASKELKAFMRRMARDRIIICFAILIVLCIIVIVILAVFKAKPWDKNK